MRHEKLVRDHIPALITQRGEQPVTRILACDEYRHELRRKLHEEVAEFCATGHVEELADVLEVVYALAALEGVSASQLEEIRQRKHTERGGFRQRIFLIETRTADGA
jgi:predicted house-cleaning noncanonical NTP pyrophosphatase (MazG superfamily)